MPCFSRTSMSVGMQRVAGSLGGGRWYKHSRALAAHLAGRRPKFKSDDREKSRSAVVALFLLSVCAEQKRGPCINSDRPLTAEMGHYSTRFNRGRDHFLTPRTPRRLDVNNRGHTSGCKPWSNQRATGRKKARTRPS